MRATWQSLRHWEAESSVAIRTSLVANGSSKELSANVAISLLSGRSPSATTACSGAVQLGTCADRGSKHERLAAASQSVSAARHETKP